MAAPNLVNVTSIYGKTKGGTLATSNADMLTCPSDKVLKINSIIVANIDGTNAADVTVQFYNADNTTGFAIDDNVKLSDNKEELETWLMTNKYNL